MSLRKRIAALAGGLILAAALAVPAFADSGDSRPDIADLPPEIQAAIEVAQQEREEAREARVAVRVAIGEIRSLFAEVEDRADVDQDRLAELRAEVERVEEIARVELEEARAASATVHELLEAAGYAPPEGRPDRGDGEGRPPRGGHRDAGPRGERGDRPGNGENQPPGRPHRDGFPGRGGAGRNPEL